MLGDPPLDAEVRREGRMIIHLRSFVEEDGEAQVNRLAADAAVPNTLLSCWIGFPLDESGAWAQQVAASIRHGL
jgi:hypothetical protein